MRRNALGIAALQGEITDEVAEKTQRAVGAPRCKACFPAGKGFDFRKHEAVRDFRLPKYPGITLEDVRRNIERQGKK